METTNLIKMRNVLLYSDIEQAPGKTADFLIALQTHKIGNYHIIEGSNNPNVLDQLRTTCFGLDFKIYPTLEMPFITWQEYYDDFERAIAIARTPDELSQSNLIVNGRLLILS